MERKTLEQERAWFCLNEVKRVKESGDAKKYKTNAERLPSLIVSNGLIQTLAFYKSKEERKQVYDTLNKWFKNRGTITNDVLEELIKFDFQKLRLATVEALSLAEWLKRIVEVEIKEEGS